MCRLLSTLFLLVLFQVGTPSSALAQDPAAYYNRTRAYRQYANSPSRLRTYSSYQAAQTWGYDSPLESGRFYLSPGYYHEQSSQYGVETYSMPQQLSSAIYLRPGIGYLPPVNVPYNAYGPAYSPYLR